LHDLYLLFFIYSIAVSHHLHGSDCVTVLCNLTEMCKETILRGSSCKPCGRIMRIDHFNDGANPTTSEFPNGKIAQFLFFFLLNIW
jgi:hypothetical protein